MMSEIKSFNKCLVLVSSVLDQRQRTPKGQSKRDNPEKLATQGTQDEDKQNITQYMLDTTIDKSTQIT